MPAPKSSFRRRRQAGRYECQRIARLKDGRRRVLIAPGVAAYRGAFSVAIYHAHQRQVLVSRRIEQPPMRQTCRMALCPEGQTALLSAGAPGELNVARRKRHYGRAIAHASGEQRQFVSRESFLCFGRPWRSPADGVLRRERTAPVL